jgi:multiple sugar transport system permease protein
MATFEETGPRAPVTISTRVDRIRPAARLGRTLRAILVVIITLIMLIPVLAMGITAFKSRNAVVSVPPSLIPVPNGDEERVAANERWRETRESSLARHFFTPTLEGFVFLLTERAQIGQARAAELQELRSEGTLSLAERIALDAGQEVLGPSEYVFRLRNSLIIGGVSTIASVVLGLFAAYAFSRFNIRGENDLLFFILSTRMLPPVVVTIPLFLMYRQLGLHDTHIGMILLYTAFNLSLSVWLLKGFIDEIPKEYEEAALVDGYSRLQAFFRVVLPQAVGGIAATTVFCLIFAWNEYAFALMLTSEVARTAPPSIATMLGRGGIEWSAIAAGSLGFLIPVVIVTFALRNYLLRGVTFGAIRQ